MIEIYKNMKKMKNKKYRNLKIFPSDIIQIFKNIVKFNQNKLFKLKIPLSLLSRILKMLNFEFCFINFQRFTSSG